VRKIFSIYFGLWLCCALAAAHADTFQLTDGKTITGEPLTSTADETGMKIRTGDGEYQQVPWTSFSQDDLKKFQADDPKKLAPLVEPFIEISQAEKIKKTEVEIKPVPRLDRPASRSLFGAMFSTGVGAFVLLLLYAANLYAAFEVSVFRARPAALVCGVSAILPLIGPIIFLSMPTLMEPGAQETDMDVPTGAPQAAGAAHAAPSHGATASPPADSDPLAPEAGHAPTAGGLHIAHTEQAAASSLPETQKFARGAFTFNRRFFETKFPGFFGVVKRDADKDLVLIVKAARGEYTGTRITRITGNDFHLEVHKGGASEEVLIPFTEIKEVQLKHKDAP
jgi:hypothetical protein